MSMETLLILAFAIPAAGTLLILMSDGKPNQRETVTMVTALSLFAVIATIAVDVFAGKVPRLLIVDVFPYAPLAFKVEPLGMLFALIASFLWIINSIYSIGYMRGNREGHQTRFYACFAAAIFSALGIAFAENLLTLFIFYEMLTLTTYPLVTHSGKPEAIRAGRIYIGILLGSSIALLLMAILATFAFTGTLDFKPGGIMAGKVAPVMGSILLFMFVYGIGKAALMPIHPWLPNAMVAPTPVSALLHAVAVVKAGVFTVVKVVVYIFGPAYIADLPWSHVLVYLAGGTVIIASLIALGADNLKRRLAYSTISQLSYVIMAAALLTPAAIMGAALHIATHAFGKITLFFAAGSIYTAAHKTKVSELDGIGRRMPWTMAAFSIGALSMIGLPPTAGFISKWYILTGAFQASDWFAIGVLVVSTLLNAGYFLPVIYRAFFRAPEAPTRDHDAHGEAPLPIVIALTITACGTLLMFFFPQIPLALARGLVG